MLYVMQQNRFYKQKPRDTRKSRFATTKRLEHKDKTKGNAFWALLNIQKTNQTSPTSIIKRINDLEFQVKWTELPKSLTILHELRRKSLLANLLVRFLFRLGGLEHLVRTFTCDLPLHAHPYPTQLPHSNKLIFSILDTRKIHYERGILRLEMVVLTFSTQRVKHSK